MKSAVPALLFMLLLPVLPLRAEIKGPEQKATEAAEAWLSLVDEGKYEESWNAAAEYFRRAVTKEQWQQSLKAVRSPLGAVKSREVIAATYMTEIPGAPDGEYVVIQFSTSYENKKSAVETVTPMKETDESWKVSGYYIK